MAMVNHYRTAIVGAGPSGCLLARLLLNNSSFQVAVFEADSSLTIRRQGGTLDLHEKTGIAALKKAGLYTAFLQHARPDGSGFLLCDKQLNGYFQFPVGVSSPHNDNSDRTEIDRFDLRQLLIDSLPPQTIRWGCKVLSVTDGNILHFEQGESEGGFDLVVGADGAWSHIRRFLTAETPIFCGIVDRTSLIPDAANTAPEVSTLVNGGSLFAYSDGKGLIAQQLGDGSIEVSSCASGDANNATVSALEGQTIHGFNDWDPKLVGLLKRTTIDFGTRSIYRLPTGFRWKNRPGVTLMGDAAHLMPPFAGEGVNLALEDAMRLADAMCQLVEGGSEATYTLERSLREYEEDLFQRARAAQELSTGAMEDMFFTPGAPRTAIERWIIRQFRYQLPRWLFLGFCPLIFTGVYSFYFIFKCFV